MPNYRKDALPQETIKNIRYILENIGIDTDEIEYNNENMELYSVRVEISQLNGVGTNGKGKSRELALASAYAELLERIQSNVLIKPLFNAFDKKIYLPAGLNGGQNELNKVSELFSEDIDVDYIIKNQKDYLPDKYAPYFNVMDQRTDYLPEYLIERFCGSNGLCAGNSPEEAISQGICEVLERYVNKSIMKGNVSIPNIKIEDIHHTESFNTIRELEKNGYTVTVKDCTLGGIFPVIGVLVLNKDKTKYFFHLGSDIDLDIALQRCLTEIFQGVQLNNFEDKRMKYINFKDSLVLDNSWNYTCKANHFRYNEWCKLVVDGKGNYPIKIFLNNKEDCDKKYKKAFMSGLDSNKKALDNLVSILKKNDLKLYIRDHSILGFPTYRVFISTITDVTMMSDDELKYLSSIKKTREIMQNMLQNGDEELLYLKNHINFGGKIPNVKMFGVIDNLFRVSYKNKKQKIENYDEFWLGWIEFKLGNLEKAIKYFIDIIVKLDKLNQNDQISRLMPLVIYIKNTLYGVLNDDINQFLYSIYNITFEDYLEKFEQSIIVPNCPNCNSCKELLNCNIDNWKVTMNKLSLNSRYIDISDVSSVFN